MMEHADALIAYRTYPHVDMADTGRACARHLALMLKAKARFAKAFRQLPFLIPISWQCTNDQPTKGIYEKLAALESDAVPTLSFAPGFPAADFRDCGPSVFTYGRTQADADAAADKLVALVESRSSSPTPRTILAPAAIPTPRACCARWCATRPPVPPA
jgi:microcystin degradation protein MlrC